MVSLRSASATASAAVRFLDFFFFTLLVNHKQFVDNYLMRGKEEQNEEYLHIFVSFENEFPFPNS